MEALRHGSLFSGIGGFDLAAEWMGWENVFHCEWNQFGQRILKHYWPNAISYEDITKTDFTKHCGTIDIISGGFPCQPYSTAGKRKGKDDERHLWPEMLRAIREVKPSFVVGENVRGLVNWDGGVVFDEVHTDLEAEGFEVAPFLIPACSVGAPHKRDRIWFVAYSKSNGLSNALANRELEGRRPRKRNKPPTWDTFPSAPLICGGNDGLSAELDGITLSKWREETVKAYGNAIVPQVAYEIFKAIELWKQSMD
jgi:DNA (cytosine-5)-methyltransferase 1